MLAHREVTRGSFEFMSSKPQSSEQPVELPNFYFNGFQLALSNADINGVLMLNNQPSIAISMSYTTAKTLAIALNDMVKTLETVTQHEIMTTNEVGSGLERINSNPEVSVEKPN